MYEQRCGSQPSELIYSYLKDKKKQKKRYCVNSNNCDVSYIAQTIQYQKKRISQHKSSIITKDLPLYNLRQP